MRTLLSISIVLLLMASLAVPQVKRSGSVQLSGSSKVTTTAPGGGPISVTTLTSNFSATDLTSYATASISPTANQLVLAVVSARMPTAPVTPTASGGGMTTWTQVATMEGFGGGPSVRITIFRALQASPTSGALTFSFGASAQSYCLWSVFQIDGVDTGGTNGSAAIVQAVTSVVLGASSHTVTLAAFESADNGTVGAFHANNPGAPDTNFIIGSGFTKIHAFRELTESDNGLLTEWRVDNDTSVNCTYDASDSLGIALEIKAG